MDCDPTQSPLTPPSARDYPAWHPTCTRAQAFLELGTASIFLGSNESTATREGRDMPTLILRRPEVSQRTGLGRSALYAEIQAERFPKPVKLGRRAVGWIEAEVAEWIADRVEARDREEASR